MEGDLRNGSVPTSEAVVVVCSSDVCQMGDSGAVLSWLNVGECSGTVCCLQLALYSMERSRVESVGCLGWDSALSGAEP